VGLLKFLVEQVGHRNKLERAVWSGEGIAHRTRAAWAAADDGKTDGVVFRGVDVRQRDARKRRDRSDPPRGLDEFAPCSLRLDG